MPCMDPYHIIPDFRIESMAISIAMKQNIYEQKIAKS